MNTCSRTEKYMYMCTETHTHAHTCTNIHTQHVHAQKKPTNATSTNPQKQGLVHHASTTNTHSHQATHMRRNIEDRASACALPQPPTCRGAMQRILIQHSTPSLDHAKEGAQTPSRPASKTRSAARGGRFLRGAYDTAHRALWQQCCNRASDSNLRRATASDCLAKESGCRGKNERSVCRDQHNHWQQKGQDRQTC